MKKEKRKKLENELIKVVEATFSKHDSRATAELKKEMKQAAKSLAKKFSKALKGLKPVKAAATSKKASSPVKKSASGKKKSGSRPEVSGLKKLSASASPRRVVRTEESVLPVTLPEPVTGQLGVSENNGLENQ